MIRAGLPRWLLVPAALSAIFIVTPIVAMLVRVDPIRFLDLLTTQASLDALELSLRTCVTSTVLCLILGVPLAMVLARTSFPGRSVLRAAVLLPLVLPPVVSGLALLYTFGRRGLLGSHFEVIGTTIAFSTAAVVIAQTFVSLPFLVLSLEGALRASGARFEPVAAALGASPSRVFWRVTVPLLRPAIFAGAVLSFARALGEFGATLTFAGSLQGRTRTLPLEIYLQREADPDAAVALSVLLIFVAIALVLTVRPRVAGVA